MLLPLLFALAPSVPQAPAAEAPEARRVAIVVFQGVELLDFAGPGEVFSSSRSGRNHLFDVCTVAASTDPIVSQGFVTVTPEYSFADCPAPDIVVIPGGSVPLSNAPMLEWVKGVSKESELVMSVCNGALVLAACDLVNDLDVTTHRSALEGLQLLAPTSRVLTNRRFVDHGSVLTSAGVSAGIDSSLHVVSRLHGMEVARATAHYMEYDWRPEEIAELHEQPGAGLELTLEMELLGRLREASLGSVIREYERRDAAGEPVASEDRLNRVGYRLFGAGRKAEALRVLEFVAATHPQSSNAHDSLAEILELSERAVEARAWSERALELLPDDASVSADRAARLRQGLEARLARLSDPSYVAEFVCSPCGMPCDQVRLTRPGFCAVPDCGKILVLVATDSPPSHD